MIMFINKQMAREGGMTHEGTVYGMPCWLADIEDPEMITAVTKFYPLNFYLAFMDKVFETVAYMIPSANGIATPLTVKGPIE